jgi:hypothetical protein
MIQGLALVLLLATAPGRQDPLAATRAELDGLAARIEQLKARQLEGENVRRELERLLVRAQELAGRIEASLELDEPLPIAPVPSAEELRERADAARDEADRLATVLHVTEARMAQLRREARLGQQLGVTGVAVQPGAEPDRAHLLRKLAADRLELSRRMHAALAEAARLDAEADAIETERVKRR